MNNFKKYIVWSSCFFLIACTNISQFCRHTFINQPFFNFNQRPSGVFLHTNTAAPLTNSKLDIAVKTQPAVKITWNTLADVEFVKRWSKEYELDIFFPVFSDPVKKLKGKEVYISGYMIPWDIKKGIYALSKSNFASCFFCGQSGPETVVSLKFKAKPRRYDTDEYLTFKGIFELNDTNFNDFIYIFRGAEEYRVK